MSIEYKVNENIGAEQFIELLKNSTLGERRPLNDYECMKGMISNSNLVISAWADGLLVGIARSITDFHFACYISDLAVSSSHQRKGIGKKLLVITQNHLGPKCKLILLAAPAANSYYEHIGFSNNSRCWVLDRGAKILD